jgi:hypothetical protein
MSLQEDFAKRNAWFNNRSSAIFPAHVSRNSDTRIVFLNYWLLKNNIDIVNCNLRIYDEDGVLAAFDEFRVSNMHNDISVRRLLDRLEFRGSIEVELISPENLRFPFPAVVAFYDSPTSISAVHSAGRLKNANEPATRQRQVETNWSCTLDDEVEPYFHLFNGNLTRPEPMAVRVTVHSLDTGAQVAAATFNTGITAPYASRYVHLSDCFPSSGLNNLQRKEIFLGVEIEGGEIFPRLVVGNYNRRLHHYSATHSYTWQTNESDFVIPQGNGVASFLPMINVPELDLSAISFPTNATAEVSATERRGALGAPCSPTGSVLNWKTGGDAAGALRIDMTEPGLRVYEIKDTAPSRLNVNYRYSVKGAGGREMTDLATGFKAAFYPPKRSHWGHGVLGDGFRTVLMFRNVSWQRGATKATRGLLTIFDTEGKTEQVVEIGSEAAAAVYLPGPTHGPRRSLSWFVQFEEPTVEAFWVAFREDGTICGEHAF